MKLTKILVGLIAISLCEVAIAGRTLTESENYAKFLNEIRSATPKPTEVQKYFSAFMTQVGGEGSLAIRAKSDLALYEYGDEKAFSALKKAWKAGKVAEIKKVEKTAEELKKEEEEKKKQQQQGVLTWTGKLADFGAAPKVGNFTEVTAALENKDTPMLKAYAARASITPEEKASLKARFVEAKKNATKDAPDATEAAIFASDLDNYIEQL